MRHLGTLMLLASLAMLLGPSLWEGRRSLMPEHAESLPFDPPGQSTLRADDLLPPWRGPKPRDQKDG
jgi:hypothetical protein